MQINISELNPHCSLTFSLGYIGGKPNVHLREVKEMLELMGPVEMDDNFIGTRWSKLLINSAFSGMSAVLGCEKCGKIFMKQPWSNVYSNRDGLVILCPKCAAEELGKGTVSNILY